MEVRNLKIVTCPFEEYLLLPGWSHSAIKNFGKAPVVMTTKMMLGKDVDNYLTSPTEYNHENRDLVRPIALELKKRVGALYKFLTPQMSFTCDFIHEGFCLHYKGRADMGKQGKIVVDFKVSQMPLMKGVEYFDYDHQIPGYCLALAAPIGLIFSINPKTKLISHYNVPLQKGIEFWKYQTIQKGEPML